jgi:predicted AlkP superfamily phosphohydrolase/phosphomutase
MEKIFVIGLDGATLPLIRKWAGEGVLPNLAALVQGGTWGRLATVPNMNSAPAWTSFATGMNPGKHGIFYFYDRVPGSYGIRYVNGGDCRADHIWRIIGKTGRKVGVINVPMTYPAGEVNGFLISGMDAPGIKSKRFTFPEEIRAELLHAAPDYVIEPGITGNVKNKAFATAISTAMASIDARTKATIHFVSNHPWDFFMVVYREMDVIQHYFWKFMDPDGHEKADVDKRSYGDTIKNIYQKLDKEIGKLRQALPEDATIVILSDHGAATAEGAVPMMNIFLAHTGLLGFRKKKDQGIGRKMIGKAFSMVQKKTSRMTKEMLLRFFPSIRDHIEASIYFNGIDWEKTKAYSDGNRIELWLNLSGREPEGAVKPTEYDLVCDEIKTKLLLWCDPATKKRVVKNVFKKEEIYWGAYAGTAPDLLVRLDEEVMVTGIGIADNDGGIRILEVFAADSNVLVNGAHADNGIFILNGPGIKKGVELDAVEIVDLAPTILFLFDIDIPDEMDGKVLVNALNDDFMRGRNVRKAIFSMEKPQERPSDTYDKEDERIIHDRLKSLGYVK